MNPALWLLAPISCSVYRRVGRVAGRAGRYYARFTACCRGCSASPHPSLMLRPFSCRVRSPVPLLHPHPRCINPPSPGLSWLHRCPDLCAPCWMPWSSLMPLHCTLCSACVVPPPPPTPLPRLMRASVSVPVRLYTCYFTCIRIRL